MSAACESAAELLTRLMLAVPPWLPPALIEAVQRRRRDRTPPMWEFVSEGWRTEARFAGWDVESVAAAQVAKWPGFLRALDGPGPLAVSHESTRIDGHRRTFTRSTPAERSEGEGGQTL